MPLNPIDMTDADFDTLAFNDAARDAANGVCNICDEALDPFNPKWAGSWSERNTPESVAAAYGPPMADMPYHTRCFRDMREGR